MYKQQPEQNSDRIYTGALRRNTFCEFRIDAVLHVHCCLHRLSVFLLEHMHKQQPKQNSDRIYAGVLQRNSFYKFCIDANVFFWRECYQSCC